MRKNTLFVTHYEMIYPVIIITNGSHYKNTLNNQKYLKIVRLSL